MNDFSLRCSSVTIKERLPVERMSDSLRLFCPFTEAFSTDEI